MRKRRRDEDDEDGEGMEVDGEGEGGEGEWMDVDGEDDATPKKRRKSNLGTVAIAAKGRREPRSNRQLAGMRDDAVSCLLLVVTAAVNIF